MDFNKYGRDHMKNKLAMVVFVIVVLAIVGLIKSCMG